MPDRAGMELQDFFTEFCFASKMKTYSTATDIAGYIKRAFLECTEKSFVEAAEEIIGNLFQRLKDGIDMDYFLSEKSDFIRSVSEIKMLAEKKKVVFKMWDSFCPSVSTSISGEKLSCEIISSDSESDEDEANSQNRKRLKVGEYTEEVDNKSIEISDDETALNSRRLSSEEMSTEDWVNCIIGENGEKVLNLMHKSEMANEIRRRAWRARLYDRTEN